MAIMIALLVLVQIVCGTSTITDVLWNANLKVIEILFDKFPAKWGGWTMCVDGNEWPMEGGPGKVGRPTQCSYWKCYWAFCRNRAMAF
jgi:hypothetical protein